MKIGSATIAFAAMLPKKSGDTMPTETSKPGKILPERTFVRELAESFDPKQMSHKESMALANTLMKAGEADLSSAFLPPPLLKVNEDGSVSDMTGTPEGDAKMNAKFNMFDSLTARIDFNKSINMPTKLLEDAFSFLERIQLAQHTPSVDEYI